MKILFFVDHDIICRHFLMSGATRALEQSADVVYVFPEEGSKRFRIDPSALDLGGRHVRVTVAAERLQAWRWLLCADQLKWRPGRHEEALRRFRWRLLGWRAALLLTLASVPPGPYILQRLVARKLAAHPVTELARLIESERPDAVVHPSVLDGSFINDLSELCRKSGIPFIVAMNSWDNPSTKRSVVAMPTWLLVWGNQTKDHAVRFVGMPPDRIVPFGAAQFDVFREPPRRTRADLAKALGIPADRHLFLFAGSNAQTDEFGTLMMLDQAIDSGRLPRAVIVYRPHPWGGGGRGGSRLATARFKHVIVDPHMRGYITALATGDPGITLPDYRDTHELLALVDAVISPMSTILVEAALHEKPVIVHVPTSDDPLSPLGSALPLLHFEEFLALPDVRLTRTDSELSSAIHDLLDPAECKLRGQRLRQACAHFVAPFDKPWRERIVTFLKSVAVAAPQPSAASAAVTEEAR
jgi:hypothetical protein